MRIARPLNYSDDRRFTDPGYEPGRSPGFSYCRSHYNPAGHGGGMAVGRPPCVCAIRFIINSQGARGQNTGITTTMTARITRVSKPPTFR